MTKETKTKLAESCNGRVLLHLMALCRDYRLGWHLAEVFRELRPRNRRRNQTPQPKPMRPLHHLVVGAFVVATAMCVGVQAEDGPLVVADNEIKINVPVPVEVSLPVKMGSSLSAQYVPAPAAGEAVQLGKLVLEQSFRYPPLLGDVYSGNSIGKDLTPVRPAGRAKAGGDSPYVTSWLNKQWAGVNLSLAHTHRIEQAADQLTGGIYKMVAALDNRLFFSVGEYLFNDLSNRYWYRTTALTMDYGWNHWNLSLFIEHREAPRLREQSVWATIKKQF